MITLTESRVVFLLLLVVLAALLPPRLAGAQSTRPLEVSVAYIYVRDPTVDVAFPAGWAADVSKGVKGWFSIAAGYDDSRKTIATVAGDLTLGVRTVMAGGRASAKLGRATEFGQLLAGLVHATGNAFGAGEAHMHASVQAGAGIDYPLARRLAVRVELDYRIFIGHADDLGRQFRALTGVVVTAF